MIASRDQPEQVIVRFEPLHRLINQLGKITVNVEFGSDAALRHPAVVSAAHCVHEVTKVKDECATLPRLLQVLPLKRPVTIRAVPVPIARQEEPLLPARPHASERQHERAVSAGPDLMRLRFRRGCRVQLIGPITARRNQMRPPTPSKPRSQFSIRSWARNPVRVLSSSAARATRPGSPVFELWNRWLSARLIRCFNPIWPLPFRSCSTVSSLRLMSVRSALSVLVVLLGMRGASKGML